MTRMNVLNNTELTKFHCDFSVYLVFVWHVLVHNSVLLQKPEHGISYFMYVIFCMYKISIKSW